MSLKNLADKLYPIFIKNFPTDSVCKIFLSTSDMKTRAVVQNAAENSPADAWNIALEKLKKILQSEKIEPKILRADWVTSSEKMTWQDFNKLLGETRRNYFRRGLALDSDYKIAFTETEMNANYMMYKDGKEGSKNCIFRQNYADEYCEKRFGCKFPTPEQNQTVELFETCGAFIQEDEEPKIITGKNIYAGRRDVSVIDEETFLKLAKSGANYLARQIQKNGRYIYGHYPCFDRVVPGYNSLRHFSSTFAMLDVYGAYKKMPPMKLGKAIINALDYAAKHFIEYRTLGNGIEAAYVNDSGEIKLGANGVALLALVKYSELMHTKKYLPLMNALANGIISMQNPDGSFVHVLNTEDFSVKEPFRIVYYDGEAVFGMMRLFSITKDERLLQASELAFQRFIATNHWQNHDHWLSYAVNELTLYQPDEKYFEFGINNFLSFLPFVYHRDTQFPTLMELMMAADTMLERMKKMPEMAKLLERVNLNDFYAAMEKRAENLLNGFFWPELAMFYDKPETIVGSFFIRHHAFRVRIDDVEHFLSGFVAYCRYLERRKNLPAPVPSQELLNGTAEGTGLFNIQSTEKNSIAVESSETEKISAETKSLETSEKIFSLSEVENIDTEKFKKVFAEKNCEVLFMLRDIKKNATGLEMSSFRRAKLFKNYLGIDVKLATNFYQNQFSKNLAHYGLDNEIWNMYDYFQGIDRKNFEPLQAEIPSIKTGWKSEKVDNGLRIFDENGQRVMFAVFNEDDKKLDYINYFWGNKKYRRDTYDELGFLSLRQTLDINNGKQLEASYFNPNGTVALREFYKIVDDKEIFLHAELFERESCIPRVFYTKEDMVSHWILSVTSDKEHNFILIGERPTNYAQTYTDIKSKALTNVYVFHQMHNVHSIQSGDALNPKVITRYKCIKDRNFRVDGIVACTERQREDISRDYHLKNVFMIPHAMKEFAPSAVAKDPFKIVLVGRLSPDKGQDYAIEAFNIVSRAMPQAHLHFYGIGSTGKELQKKITELGLNNRIFLEGFAKNVADVYHSAALSICTSRIEGFSMANQESLQMGCPVVSFDCRYGPSDMIQDGVNGFLVPPGDVKALAEKIILILQNPELRQKLSENAPETVQKYSRPAVAKQWADLFTKFLTDDSSAESENSAKIFYGGDVNIGRRLHFRVNEVDSQFIGISEMEKADLRVVNLECVIATQGEQGVDKGEGGPYYFHARPEQTNILTNAGIDVVLTANNHTGDYGRAALLEQQTYLNAAGILHLGSGKNFDEAIKPLYKKVKGLTVAFFSVDATMSPFASDENTPGTAYISIKNPEFWEKIFKDRIREAHEKADLVFVAPHWGVNGVARVDEKLKTVGRLLIDLGADAVLGCHAHLLHGVENYKERPIIYDAGNFLFDIRGSKYGKGGCFSLEISANGVEKVKFVPVILKYGQTVRADEVQAAEIDRSFIELCDEFYTASIIKNDGTIDMLFSPPVRDKIKIASADGSEEIIKRSLLQPLTEPRPEWTVEKVPDEMVIPPKNFGALKLVGYHIPPECKVMKKRQMLYVETYWTIDETVNEDCRLTILGVPVGKSDMPNYGAGMTHEFCDWMWPVNRWKPGIIYRERFGLRPPETRLLVNGDLQIQIKVDIGEESFESVQDAELIKLQLPNVSK